MAMELKQEVNTDPRKKFHLLRRLKKAAKHADQLLHLSEACERCDARTRLEAQVKHMHCSTSVFKMACLVHVHTCTCHILLD